MSVDHQLDTDAPRPVGDRLLESIRQWRDADQADGPELLDHELRAIDAHRPVIEHAKGATRWWRTRRRSRAPRRSRDR